MVKCAGCDERISLREPVSAVFSQEGRRNFFHKGCEEEVAQFNRWKEEAPWAFKPARLTLSEWRGCGARKHLGVWQSIFIARRDEDVWCPDCGLKVARHENMSCPACAGPIVILSAEQTRMVFTHREPIHKLLVHCINKGEQTRTHAIITGYTTVTVTARRNVKELAEQSTEPMMLEYHPKGDPKQGFSV